MTLKHFNWTAERYGRGRVGVRLEGDRIEICQLAGNAPPAHPSFLAGLLTIEEYNEGMAAHARRVNPWCFERREGMSGAVDLRLRVLENEWMGDAPIKSVLHISMNGKLNRGYSGWIGDFVALVEWAFSPADNDIEFELEPAPIFQPAEGWMYPTGPISAAQLAAEFNAGNVDVELR